MNILKGSSYFGGLSIKFKKGIILKMNKKGNFNIRDLKKRELKSNKDKKKNKKNRHK